MFENQTMSFSRKAFQYLFCIGLLFHLSFQMGKCGLGDSPMSNKGSNYEVILEKMTWENAKTNCSKANATLLDFTDCKDAQYLKNISGKNIWIGLRKNKSNDTGKLANARDLLKISRCESINISGNIFKNVSCENLLLSVCVKPGSPCVGLWQNGSNNHECFLPVYDKMTWYGALAHCKRLDSKIFAGNFSQITFVDASHLNVKTSSFWTKNLYEIAIQRTANWTWNASCKIRETSLWEIIDKKFGCGGCGEKKNCKLYLTSNCTRNSSNVCKTNTNWTCIFDIDGFCLQMPSQEGHDIFCLQQWSRVNLSDTNKTITKPASLGVGRREWNSNASINVYSLQDPLQGWYWLNGEQFCIGRRRGLYGELSSTGPEERCAMIRTSKNGIWEDIPCDERHSFICKAKNGSGTTNQRKGEDVGGLIFDVLNKETNQTQREDVGFSTDKLLKVINGIHQLVNSSDYSGFHNSGNIKVEVFTTTLSGLRNRTRKMLSIMSIPMKTVAKLCRNQANCAVKEISIQLTNLPINFNNNSRGFVGALSDIIVFDYIIRGELMSKLDENETVSLNFHKKTHFELKQARCRFLVGKDTWSEKGMKVNYTYDGEYVQCLTDHLSSFTMVVLSDEGGEEEAMEADEVALMILNYVGSGLSLACQLFTFVVYVLFYKDLQILTTSRHLVHLNLQIALALTQIFFLPGGIAVNNKAACTVVAIFVHYFSLASFVWMLLEVTMLYLKLVSVYRGEFVRIKYFLIFGWGLPLLVVGISAWTKIDAYGTNQWCWLSYEDGFLWIFFAPVIITTSVSIVTVTAVVRILYIASKSEEGDTSKGVISAARGVVILFPTLGLAWGFGVIAVNHDALVWKYLFAIFTSLQGFFVFVIYGVCNQEIRTAVSRKIRGNDVRTFTSTT